MVESMGEIQVVQINDLKRGSKVMIDGHPSKITDIQTSKTGKHGHAKARIEAVGVLDDKKRIIIKPTGDKIEVPIIEKKTAQVLSISGKTAQVMNSETFETFDMEIPADMVNDLNEGASILYWEVLDKKIMKQIKKE